MTVVADSMSNDLNIAYAGLPERFYIIRNGVVVCEGKQGPWGFQPELFAGWLKTYRNTLRV